MKKIITALISLVIVAVILFNVWREYSAFVYATYNSPNSKYIIRVTEYPRLLGHMPGDAGGGSGYVELIEVQTSRVLERKSVNMVMTIDTVYWEPHQVYIKLFYTWPLP